MEYKVGFIAPPMAVLLKGYSAYLIHLNAWELLTRPRLNRSIDLFPVRIIRYPKHFQLIDRGIVVRPGEQASSPDKAFQVLDDIVKHELCDPLLFSDYEIENPKDEDEIKRFVARLYEDLLTHG